MVTFESQRKFYLKQSGSQGLNVSTATTLFRATVLFISSPYVYTDISHGLNITGKVKTKSKLKARHEHDAKCFHTVR